MESQILPWIIGTVAVVIAFLCGRQFEREEAPRKKAAQFEADAREGALISLAMLAEIKGEGSPEVAQSASDLDFAYPGTSYQWSLQSSSRRRELAQQGFDRLQDPEVRKEMDRSNEEMKRIKEEILADLCNMR